MAEDRTSGTQFLSELIGEESLVGTALGIFDSLSNGGEDEYLDELRRRGNVGEEGEPFQARDARGVVGQFLEGLGALEPNSPRDLTDEEKIAFREGRLSGRQREAGLETAMFSRDKAKAGRPNIQEREDLSIGGARRNDAREEFLWRHLPEQVKQQLQQARLQNAIQATEKSREGQALIRNILMMEERLIAASSNLSAKPKDIEKLSNDILVARQKYEGLLQESLGHFNPWTPDTGAPTHGIPGLPEVEEVPSNLESLGQFLGPLIEWITRNAATVQPGALPQQPNQGPRQPGSFSYHPEAGKLG